jgi:hypothetical protein
MGFDHKPGTVALARPFHEGFNGDRAVANGSISCLRYAKGAGNGAFRLPAMAPLSATAYQIVEGYRTQSWSSMTCQNGWYW